MNEQAIRAVVAHWRHIAVAAWGGAGIQHAGKAIGDFADDIIAALNDNTTCVTNCSVCKNRAVTDAMIESERYLMRLQLAAAAADDILQAWRDDPHLRSGVRRTSVRHAPSMLSLQQVRRACALHDDGDLRPLRICHGKLNDLSGARAMSSLTVYVTVRYKCPDFVDQESVDEFGLLNIVEDMFKDETPAEWTDERPVLVSVSLHPDGESTVADIAAEQGVKPLQDFDALAMPEQSS